MNPQPHRSGSQAWPGLTVPVSFLLLFLLLSLTGCGGGMSDAVKQDSKTLKDSLSAADKFIRGQEEKYNRLASSTAFAPMAGYAQNENWAQHFSRAGETLDRARQMFDRELTPIMDKNDPNGEVKARIQINRIRRAIKEARTQAAEPFSRADRIRAAMEGTQTLYVDAGNAGRQVLEKIRDLEQGPVQKAREKFPDSREKILNRFAPFSAIQADTQTRLALLEKEYQAFNRSDPVDFAGFIDSVDGINRDLQRLDKEIPDIQKDIAQLYQSYTKVLQDMKTEYYVTVKRESWDEHSDYYKPAFATFRRQVTPAVFQTLNESNLETIADLTPVYGRPSLKNRIGNSWNSLEINPLENWPHHMNHNAASFWIEGTDTQFFHKYIQEANGETQETDWVKVNPSFFEQNLDNLGMAILSKPYGEFEPDTQAAPPGMAYVGNPAYGQWQEDENGESFWAWYGRYAFFSNLFFFPSYHYRYGSWDRWHKGYRYKKPYYGKTKSGSPIFGTRGSVVKKTPRYQNTTFARTGGFKTGPASVRGASLRGGGPKGKGK